MKDYQNLIVSSLVGNIKKVYDRAGKDKKFKNYMSELSSQSKEELEQIIKESKEIALSIDKYKSSKEKITNQALESVFNVFRTNINNDKTLFDTTEEFLPKRKSSISKNDYLKIASYLESNMDKLLDNKNLNSILSIMENKLSQIPFKSSGERIYDISLYDNAKLTAAIVGCNYYSFIEGNNSDKKYILLSADVSGIQSFIYTISSKGALKSLRGRSFYLEIIVENIIDDILQEIGLCRANLLYSGGGHFYMLLPNTERVKDIIDKAKVNINEWFLKRYSIDLYIEISYVEVGEDQLCNKDKNNNLVGQMYRDVGSKNSKGKLQRYTLEQLEQIMFEGKNEQDEKECLICHKSFKVDAETGFCINCTNIIELGTNLPRIYDGKKYIVIRDTYSNKSLEIPTIYENRKSYLTCEDESKLNSSEYKRIYCVNKKKKLGENIVNIYAGIYSKESEEDTNLISFEELASKSIGVKKLGVLRADVDNLGKAFINGFEKSSGDKYEYISLSRNCNLSYSLSKFFKYEINKISKGSLDNRFKLINYSNNEDRNVVIVYAGGDDLFIVGAWNEIIELAVDINNLFKKFTNNKMTLSAGIGIFNSKYPINQIANQVGDLEGMGKSNGKDRLCLFDKEGKYLHTWDEFENKVCREKIDKIYTWFDFEKQGKKLPIGMSILYRLLTLIRNIRDGNRINLARIAYVIGRMEPGKDKKEIYLDFKETFYKWVLNEQDLKELETALTLIVYLNRKGEDRDGLCN